MKTDSILKVLEDLDDYKSKTPKEKLRICNKICLKYGVKMSDVILYENSLKY